MSDKDSTRVDSKKTKILVVIEPPGISQPFVRSMPIIEAVTADTRYDHVSIPQPELGREANEEN